MFLTEFTSPYSLNTQRGWHTSEVHSILSIIIVNFTLNMHQFTRTEQRPKNNTERALKPSRRQNSMNFLGQTGTSRGGFPTFRELTVSPSSEFAGGLEEQKQFWDVVREVYARISTEYIYIYI